MTKICCRKIDAKMPKISCRSAQKPKNSGEIWVTILSNSLLLEPFFEMFVICEDFSSNLERIPFSDSGLDIAVLAVFSFMFPCELEQSHPGACFGVPVKHLEGEVGVACPQESPQRCYLL